jgi:hypothetical protein
MKTLAWTVIGGVAYAAFVGCSAGGDGSGGEGGNSNGTGAKNGTAGITLGGNTSTSGGPSLGGDVNNNTAGSEMGCNDLTVETKEVTPTVVLLVDNSSSMFEPREMLWDPLHTVLMKDGDGIVASLQEKVRFGFTSYRGSKTINDPACPNLFEVEPNLQNYAAINTRYETQSKEYKQGDKWETPTGAALRKVAEKLAAYNPDPPGPKYIVLVTDGNPNTCGALDPQCGSDESIKAVQDAKAMGIGTFAVGIGDIVTTNSGCEAVWGRCGVLHLQDVANAGQGLPVQAPPDGLRYQACTPTQMLAATYAAVGAPGGTAPYFTAANEAELKTALSGLLNSVASCTYDMNATVVGNPALGTVKINGVDVPYNDPNGWKLEDNKVQVTLQGTACDTFKSMPGAKLLVSFPCKVAVPK